MPVYSLNGFVLNYSATEDDPVAFGNTTLQITMPVGQSSFSYSISFYDDGVPVVDININALEVMLSSSLIPGGRVELEADQNFATSLATINSSEGTHDILFLAVLLEDGAVAMAFFQIGGDPLTLPTSMSEFDEFSASASWSGAATGAFAPGVDISLLDLMNTTVSDEATGGGSAVDDAYFGTIGDDIMDGGDGDDELGAGGGNDELYGDAGMDTLWGAAGDDTMYGGTENDQLGASAGNDLLYGEEGDDVLWAGGDNDQLLGGAGNDEAWGGTGNDYVNGGDGNDLIGGGAGDDVVLGDTGTDTLWGGSGDDAMDGGADADQIGGGAGSDTIYGGSGNDTIWGAAGNDSISGDDEDDEIWGGAGDDEISGDAGNDILGGGAGMNWLDGGAGDDSLYGGGDADSFVFSEGADRVINWDAADVVDLSANAAFMDFADLAANHMTQVGANTVIDDGAGNTMTLVGVTASTLIDGDFMFM